MNILQWKNFNIIGHGCQNSRQEIRETSEAWDANIYKKEYYLFSFLLEEGCTEVQLRDKNILSV